MAQLGDLAEKEDTESFGASNNVNGVAISQYGRMMAVAGSSFVQLFTVQDLSLSLKWKLQVCHDPKVKKLFVIYCMVARSCRVQLTSSVCRGYANVVLAVGDGIGHCRGSS